MGGRAVIRKLRMARRLACLLGVLGLLPLHAVEFDVSIAIGASTPPVIDSPPHVMLYARASDHYRAVVTEVGLAQLQAMGHVIDFIGGPRQPADYPPFSSIESQLQDWADDFPNICQLTSIGQSVEGRELWVVTITDNPTVEEAEPEVKLVANMHGDETSSQDVAMRFIDHLLNGYGVDDDVTALVDATEIQILPIMNPDGYVATTRANDNGEDLNRNFPNPFSNPTVQPETQAVMDWTAAHNFVLSAGIHSGAVGIVYSWGHDHEHFDPEERFPETQQARDICFAYTALNPTMFAVNDNPPGWENGVINGCDWFAINGEMADWNYRYHGCFETTIELSLDKNPPAEDLDGIWDDNRDALLGYVKQAHRGIRGTVRSAADGSPIASRVQVSEVLSVELPAFGAGWQPVVLPITPLDDDLNAVFPTATIAWAYDVENHTFAESVTLTAEMGYWIHFDVAPGAVTVQGTYPPQESRALPRGWSFVGLRPSSPFPAGDTISPQVYVWDNVVNPGFQTVTAVTPEEPHWVLGLANTTLSLGAMTSINPPLPVWSDRGAGSDANGDYYRMLQPGTYSLWFEDDVAPSIEHEAPGNAAPGTAIVLAADVSFPHQTTQVHGLVVPSGEGSDGIPNRLVHDVALPRAANCFLSWRQLPAGAWQELATVDVGSGSVNATIPGQPTGTEIEYQFVLRNGHDQTVVLTEPSSGTFMLTVD